MYEPFPRSLNQSLDKIARLCYNKKGWKMENLHNSQTTSLLKTLAIIRRAHSQSALSLSYSGGLDSNLIHHILQSYLPFINSRVPRFYAHTHLSLPEVRQFIFSQTSSKPTTQTSYGFKIQKYSRTSFNAPLFIVYPKKKFPSIVSSYGYPVISKEVSAHISRSNWDKVPAKWQYLKSAPFNISEKCCNYLKEAPLTRITKKLSRATVTGMRSAESSLRAQQVKCLSFTPPEPSKQRTLKSSAPLAHWTHQEVLHYYATHRIPYPSCYGEIKYNSSRNKYETTLLSRTGCYLCPFGMHLERPPNRFQILYKTHPKLWNYAINKLNLKEIFEYIDVPYKPAELNSGDNYSNPSLLY